MNGRDSHAVSSFVDERRLQDHLPALRRFFRRESSADADDLVQQTLIACLESSEKFRGDSSLRTYLLRVARYQLYSHHRRCGRARRAAAAWGYVYEPTQVDEPSHESESTADHLAALIDNLPADLRLVVTMVYNDGHSRAETAALLGIPEGTVASRLRRACVRIREELARSRA